MEVIAGEARLETDVWQHGTRFRLDYSKVAMGRHEMRAARGAWG